MKILDQEWVVDKAAFLDSAGKPMTQILFLELGYAEQAVYSLKEQHYIYKGKLYPSLKQLYLDMADPTEYNFANTYLLNWRHWCRIYENKRFKPYIDEWREELDLKLKYQAHREMMMLVESEGGNYSAAKWLADRGWDKKGAGRPSKADKERSLRIHEKISEDFQADVIRLQDYK
jgi:hypothetical protein